ncbi:MAG: AAA family ATPase [Candidatus Babeliaceae bacterium]|jgi:ATP-dependent Zn protease
MIFLRKYMSIALFFAISGTFSLALSAEKAGASSTELLSTTSRLNELYAIAMQKLDQTQAIVQHCAQLINNNKLKPQDGQAARAWLKHCSEVLTEIKNSPYSPLTDVKLVEIFAETKQFAQRLTFVIASNLNELPDMSRETLKARYVPDEISEEMMFEYIGHVDRALGELQNAANGIGQNFINKTFNTVSSLNSRYKFGSWVGNAALVGFGAATLLYVTPRSALETVGLGGAQDTMIDTFSKVVSKKPYMMFDGNYVDEIINKEPVKIKVLEPVDPHKYFASELGGNFDRLVLAGSAWLAYLKAQDVWHQSNKYWPWPQISEKLTRAQNKVHSFLKGAPLGYDGVVGRVIDDVTLKDGFFKGFDSQLNKFNNILTFVMDPKKFVFSGMKMNKALLLTGPSGTGKSFFAKAFAGSVNEISENNEQKKVKFLEISHFMLQGQENPVEFIMYYARFNAPCVVYIDEFHLLQLQVQGNTKRLSEFLMELDKLDKDNDPDHQIFILGATNRPDLLDPALMRDGRFEVVQFHNPTFEQRRNLLEELCKKSAINTTGIDFELLAHLTEGCSFSSLNKLFERAAFVAKNQGEGVTFEHLYQALNEVVRKLKKDVPVMDVEKNIVATYQGGKALAYSLFATSVNLESVTLQGYTTAPREVYDWQVKTENKDIKRQYKPRFGAIFTWKNYEVVAAETIEEKKNLCKILVAGFAAQQVLNGSVSAYKKKDRQRALLLAQNILLQGLNFADLSDKQKDIIKDQALEMVRACERDMIKLFTQKKEVLKRIVVALEEKTMLRVDEIKALIA